MDTATFNSSHLQVLYNTLLYCLVCSMLCVFTIHKYSALAMSMPSLNPASIMKAAFNATIFFYPTLEYYKAMYTQSIAAGLRYNAPFNTIFHVMSLATPSSRLFITPNVDTLYSTAWLDLRAEPLILHVPRVTNQDGHTPRYYSVDAYTHTTLRFKNDW